MEGESTDQKTTGCSKEMEGQDPQRRNQRRTLGVDGLQNGDGKPSKVARPLKRDWVDTLAPYAALILFGSIGVALVAINQFARSLGF